MPDNSLLACVPVVDGEPHFPGLERVDVRFGQVLHEQNRRIVHVYFPVTALVSLVAEGGVAVEVGIIGRDGMTGVSVALGNRVSPARAVVQVPGRAFRAETRDFLHELQRSPRLREAVYRYSDDLAAQAVRSAACIRNHTPEQRLARWLLMMHDRLQRERFALTQEYLGYMLGVRRAAISDAAGRLRRRRLIRYARGTIEILDSSGLEGASCECYVAWPTPARAAEWRRVSPLTTKLTT